MLRYRLEFRHTIPTFDASSCASHENFPGLTRLHAKYYFKQCLLGILPWNSKIQTPFVLIFLARRMAEGWQIPSNYPEFRHGIPAFDSSCCASRGIFLSWRSCTPNTIPSNACLEFCPGIPELENYFFKFSWPAGWQDIKKCHAINWNSVMEFQHAIPFVVQVTGGILSCISWTRKSFLPIFVSRRMAAY